MSRFQNLFWKFKKSKNQPKKLKIPKTLKSINKIFDMTYDSWCDCWHDWWHASWIVKRLVNHDVTHSHTCHDEIHVLQHLHHVILLGVVPCNDSNPIVFSWTNHDLADHFEAVTKPLASLIHLLNKRQRQPVHKTYVPHPHGPGKTSI